MFLLFYANTYYCTHGGEGRATWQLEFCQIPTQFTRIDYFGLFWFYGKKIF